MKKARRKEKISLGVVLVLFMALVGGWFLGFSKSTAQSSIESQREAFSAALKAYYIGVGDLDTVMDLYADLRKSLDDETEAFSN